MAHDPIEHARESFRRHVVRCADAPAEVFLLRVRALVRLGERDPFLREVLQTLQTELDDFERDQARDRAEVQLALAEIRRLAEEQDPAIAAVGDRDSVPGYTLAGYDTPSRTEHAIKFPDGDFSDEAFRLHYLTFLISLLPDESAARQGEGSAWARLEPLRPAVAHLHQERVNFAREHGGAAWDDLRQCVAMINPRPGEDLPLGHASRRRIGLYGSVNPGVSPSFFVGPEIERSQLRIMEKIRTVLEEVELRLGLRGTHDGVLRRYAWSATYLRRDELIALAGRNTRKAERALTTDAAAFLFAQGFDVVTELSLGASRLDLASFGDALLVEAKIYRTPAAGREAAIQGCRQVLHYASGLRASRVRTDNFVLVFRLGGDRVELPAEPLDVGPHVVRFVHVDLAPAIVSGSRSGRVHVMTRRDQLDGVTEPEEPKRRVRKRR